MDDWFPITIPGTPVPQGSKSVTKGGIMFEANRNLKPWRTAAVAHLTSWTGTFFGAWEPYDGPLIVDVTFYMPEPKRPKYALPAVKPDTDKLQRALGDVLTIAQIIHDDARITTWHATKRYGEPRTVINAIREDKR